MGLPAEILTSERDDIVRKPSHIKIFYLRMPRSFHWLLVRVNISLSGVLHSATFYEGRLNSTLTSRACDSKSVKSVSEEPVKGVRIERADRDISYLLAGKAGLRFEPEALLGHRIVYLV